MCVVPPQTSSRRALLCSSLIQRLFRSFDCLAEMVYDRPAGRGRAGEQFRSQADEGDGLFMKGMLPDDRVREALPHYSCDRVRACQ